MVISSLLQISSSGLLGIGTNPTQALHVQGSTIVSGAIGIGITNPTANLVVYNGTASAMLPFVNISGGGTISTINKVGINISPWSQEAGRPGGPATQIAGLDDALGSAHMTFATAVNNTTYGSGNGLGALTERMRITSAGTVGIGTNNPSSMLDVRPVGTGDAPNYGISHYFPSTYSATVYANQLVASLRFKWYSDLWDIAGIRGGSTSWQSLAIRYNGTEYITIGTNGNVGIGATSPAASLDVNGSIISRGQVPSIAFLGDIDGAKWNAKLGGYNLSFGSDSGSFTGYETATLYGRTYQYGIQMTSTGGINTKGYVGIGTNSPAQTLDVYGTIARSGLKLPRFDYGTLGWGTTVSIPILFSDTQYNMVEIRFRYVVDTQCDIYMSALSTASAAMTLQECGLTISQYKAPTTPSYWNNYAAESTSFIFASSVETSGLDNNLMFRIVRATGTSDTGLRNHYSFDNVYCWYGVGTARGYGQGHINNASVGGPAVASLRFSCTVGNINGSWSTTHYN